MKKILLFNNFLQKRTMHTSGMQKTYYFGTVDLWAISLLGD